MLKRINKKKYFVQVDGDGKPIYGVDKNGEPIEVKRIDCNGNPINPHVLYDDEACGNFRAYNCDSKAEIQNRIKNKLTLDVDIKEKIK